jgi:GTP-binding protein
LAQTIDKVSAELAKHPAAYPEVLVTSSRFGSGIPELRAAVASLLPGVDNASE